MIPQVFFSGLLVIGLGFYARDVLVPDDALAFLQGALTLGGGLIICGLFSLKARWHGVIGAGVIALLGAARGLANLPDLAAMLAGNAQRGPAPVMEFGVTAICLVLLLRVLTALARERTRRMLDQAE
jgi:hypothetical protein